jgi:glycosyltransferase involved in cell wall biosynthesis
LLLEQEFGLKKGNEQQVLKDDIHIFPNDFFCPKVFHTKEIILTENSHAIHHFAASWFNAEPAEQQNKKEGGHLGKHKICVYAICKNEEQFVDRWMDSVSEADLVVVADTGSTDNTVEKLRQRGAQVYSFENKPFRFDYSRNYALKFVPDDVDICVSPDLDEVFNPGWRKNLDEQWRDDTTRGTYLYNWSFAEDGTPMVQYVHERIHARHNYHWIYPTHEMLEYTGPGEEKRQYFDGVVFNHHPDPKKDRSLNLPLLELAYQERPNDGRTLHNLGREYLYAQMWEKCIDILKRYLEPGVSDWDEERSASMRLSQERMEDLATCTSRSGGFIRRWRKRRICASLTWSWNSLRIRRVTGRGYISLQSKR